ncbi:nitrous oxide reductase accessory protein NosL [Ruixingdingia sedimenti]|uniref:Nitrous oxide reductase accessory protein NosL n=1 Tax=Ruixingdingia sedimenti TaxID=3073604 RepID=A0ABU1F9T3_9RHOB|nr:nitrous oxide reductase accessory protein NosL [Xinfangfangia sp. LG-4]MDR5653641.1 nitrous oxide reductase accessory protein NosL [Xinfangfangia sp. LG-4]
MKPHPLALALAALLALAACREDTAALPQPSPLTVEAVGHYCQMDLLEHPGPKGQVHLAGMPAPLFFSQVRDAIAYQRMPEQSHLITIVYVTDMAAADGWDPGVGQWIEASKAIYVVGSHREGGMGAPEFVPFSDRAAALAFAAEWGGELRALSEIRDDEVLTPVAVLPEGDTGEGDDADFTDRLRKLSENLGG